MQTTEFEAGLKTDGFTVVEPKSLPPGTSSPAHTHVFDVRALVTAGEITLHADGRDTRYGVGEVFTMARGQSHAEHVGPQGVSYIVGRRGLHG